jgi:hypothetical protein
MRALATKPVQHASEAPYCVKLSAGGTLHSYRKNCMLKKLDSYGQYSIVYSHRDLFLNSTTVHFVNRMMSSCRGAHTKRLLAKTSPRQNVSIQNVYAHNASLTKRLCNETSPVTKRLCKKTSPRPIFNILDSLFKNSCRLLWLG